MKCRGKHTKIQIPDEDFRCPKCGMGPEEDGLVIEDIGEGVSEDCKELHQDDFLYCYNCRYETTGKKFAALYMRKQNAVTCPTCKGKGYIIKKA